MSQAADDPVLDRAREAIDRKAWDKAYRLLSEADESRRLDGDALPTLADTAYMAGHPEVAIDAWERVHAAAVRAGEDERGAGAAGHVAALLLYTGLLAPARGWIRRAERPAGRPSGLPGPRSARGGPCLDGRPGRRPRWSPAARAPGRRHRDEAGRSGHPGPGSQRRGPHPHLPGTPPGGTRRPGRDRRGRAVRGTRPREHRTPVLQHGLRVPGAVRVSTEPRNGPTPWSAGAVGTRPGASTACAASTVRRSSGSAGTGRTPRSRLGRRRRSSAGTHGPMWAGPRRSSDRSACGWGT